MARAQCRGPLSKSFAADSDPLDAWIADATRRINALAADSGGEGLPGPPGKDGRPGAVGQPGKDGQDGKDGKNGLRRSLLLRTGEGGFRINPDLEPGDEDYCFWVNARGDVVFSPLLLREWGPEASGSPGPVGPIGPAGPQGLPGAAGAQGPAGPSGPTGPVGPIGPNGAQGSKGDKGDKGDTGPQGAQGPQGDAWPRILEVDQAHGKVYLDKAMTAAQRLYAIFEGNATLLATGAASAAPGIGVVYDVSNLPVNMHGVYVGNTA